MLGVAHIFGSMSECEAFKGGAVIVKGDGIIATGKTHLAIKENDKPQPCFEWKESYLCSFCGSDISDMKTGEDKCPHCGEKLIDDKGEIVSFIRRKIKISERKDIISPVSDVIIYALRNEIRLYATTLYLTHSPSINDVKLIDGSGIARVVYSIEQDKEAIELLEKMRIIVDKIDGVTY